VTHTSDQEYRSPDVHLVTVAIPLWHQGLGSEAQKSSSCGASGEVATSPVVSRRLHGSQSSLVALPCREQHPYLPSDVFPARPPKHLVTHQASVSVRRVWP